MENALLDVEERVKSNVRDRIKDIPAMIHRVFLQIAPPPGEDLKGDYKEMPVPSFDPENIFEGINFDSATFEFEGFDATTSYLEPTETSSASSSFEADSHYAMASSNTSVDDGNYTVAKPGGVSYQQMLPDIPEFSYPRGSY